MSSCKPIALLLSPVLPQPGGSGRALRAWDWLLELAQDYRVFVLVCAIQDSCPAIPEKYPATAVWALGEPPASNLNWTRAGLLCPALVLLTRRAAADWSSGDVMMNDLPDLLKCLDAGAVVRIVVFRLYLHDVASALARRFPLALMDLDMDDVESTTRFSIALASLRMGHYLNAALSLSAALQYWILERALTGHYQTIWLAASEDCVHVSRRLGYRTGCRPNRLPQPSDGPIPPADGEVVLLFVGSLGYTPNVDATLFLIDEVLPLLRLQMLRPWRLMVIGRQASPVLRAALAAAPQVQFIADADDLDPCYAASHIVLVPLRAGGGTKLKTLEGFAYQRPIIATRHGVRGLGAVAAEHYLQAHSPAEYVSAILMLVNNPKQAEKIAHNGHELYLQKYRLPS